MPDERRFRDDEVAEILARAVQADVDTPLDDQGGRGLTLAELQEVGRQVDVDPQRVAEAVAAIDARREALPTRRSMGMPISLDRVVSLPRPLTNSEWSSFLGQLRLTFSARGHDVSRGETRAWSNGNLYVLLQPNESGHQLRMGTRKSSAVTLNRMGVLGLGGALLVLVLALTRGDVAIAQNAPLAMLFAAGGLTMLVSNALSLPRWARERQRQFEGIAEGLSNLTAGPPARDDD